MVGLFACIPNFVPAVMGEAGTCMIVALDGEFSRNSDLCSLSSSSTAITLAEAFALFEMDAVRDMVSTLELDLSLKNGEEWGCVAVFVSRKRHASQTNAWRVW